jgi:hypothetical protein
MRTLAVTIGIALAAVSMVSTGDGAETPSPPIAALADSSFASGAESFGRPPLGGLGLAFEPNVGQTAAPVQFLARGGRGTLFFTPREIVLALESGRGRATRRGLGPASFGSLSPQGAPVLRMHFVGASAAPAVAGATRLPGMVNYFLGRDRTKWRTDVPTYAGVRYHQLYPGIDLRLTGADGSLKATYVVHPGAEPGRIRWRLDGAADVRIDKTTGDLWIELPGKQRLVDRAPVAWQLTDGGRTPVPVRFLRASDGSVGFALSRYDRGRPLILDPTLEYSTYLGGSGADYGHDVAVDAAGNAYITGATFSRDFPLAGPIQSAEHGFGDIFVSKLSANGSTLVYSTYLGGSDYDVGLGIAVDGAGNAYITGESFSRDFPVVNPIQVDPGIQQDIIVAKLNARGSALVYSTYLGGFNNQTGRDIAVDAGGSAYVAGDTLSGNAGFPIVNAVQPQAGNPREGFFLKLSPSGSSLVYSTYLGGNGDTDYALGAAVDQTGAAYVTGYTDSTDFPTANPLQRQNAGFADVFVTKLTPQGSAIVYSTYLGGASNDIGQSIALDAGGSAYIAGWTDSSDYPVANAIQGQKNAYSDVFLSKMNAAGSALVYSTFLGGGNQENQSVDVAVDGSGNAYLAGTTSSADFPTVAALQPCYSGGGVVSGDGSDAFVSKVNAAGSALVYSTFLGGWILNSGLLEWAYGLALDGRGDAYVAGFTFANDFPLSGTPLQPANAGAADAFVAKVANEPAPDFALCRVSPPVVRVKRARRTSVTLELHSLNGFAGSVTLSASGLPTGVTASFSPNPVQLSTGSSKSVVLTIKADSKASEAVVDVAIIASGGGKTHRRDIRLVVLR